MVRYPRRATGVISLAYDTTLAWNVPLNVSTPIITWTGLDADLPSPTAEMEPDREHGDVLGEEDDENETEHGDKTSLDDSSITVSLLKPSSGKDGPGYQSSSQHAMM